MLKYQILTAFEVKKVIYSCGIKITTNCYIFCSPIIHVCSFTTPHLVMRLVLYLTSPSAPNSDYTTRESLDHTSGVITTFSFSSLFVMCTKNNFPSLYIFFHQYREGLHKSVYMFIYIYVSVGGGFAPWWSAWKKSGRSPKLGS